MKSAVYENAGRVVVAMKYGSGQETVAAAKPGVSVAEVRAALRGIRWLNRTPHAREQNRSLARAALDRAGLLDHRQRPRKPQAKTRVLTIRVTERERSKLTAAAGQAGVPLSEYLLGLARADASQRAAATLDSLNPEP